MGPDAESDDQPLFQALAAARESGARCTPYRLPAGGGRVVGREVQAGEEAVELAGQAVAGLGGLHFVAEGTLAISFPVMVDDGLERAFSLRTDTEEPVAGIALFGPVARILHPGADAQVAAPIVQAVAVDVIHDHALGVRP
jgi:hypothetical protein